MPPVTPSPTGDSALLSATHVMEYDYRRSLGDVLSAFFTGLRDGRILGARCPGSGPGQAGRVIVPPAEYDPETGAATEGLVEVGPGGVVTSWAWVQEPRAEHPFARPFAWVLVRLDGADTALLHALDAPDKAGVATGMRVRARFSNQPSGGIRDIECFVAEDSP